MIISTQYIKPNVTIEKEVVRDKLFFVYNHQGNHYRLFNSFEQLKRFISNGVSSWIFECETEKTLITYMNNHEYKSNA
jgi:hypothetical protein